MDRLLEKGQFTEAQSKFVKAQAMELLRDPQAAELYEQAVNEEPDKADYLTRASAYFAKAGNLDKAIDYADRVCQIPGADTAQARGQLVVLLAERGRDADWERIDEMSRGFSGSDGVRNWNVCWQWCSRFVKRPPTRSGKRTSPRLNGD